eukprot:4691555-Pleurochrysis_carterae.AAC.1
MIKYEAGDRAGGRKEWEAGELRGCASAKDFADFAETRDVAGGWEGCSEESSASTSVRAFEETEARGRGDCTGG